MTIVSIISIILLAIMILVFAIALRKKEGGLALRTSSACGQLVVALTTILYFFLMAQESVIYDNAQTGLQEAEGIDLFFMSKAAGVLCLIALVVTVGCFVGTLFEKPTVVFVGATLLLLVGVITAIVLVAIYSPIYYYATLTPAVIVGGWCLMVLGINSLFSTQKGWCRIVVAIFNTINFVLMAVLVTVISLLAKDVVAALSEYENIMVVVFAIILIIAALPSVLNFIYSVIDTVKLIKSVKKK